MIGSKFKPSSRAMSPRIMFWVVIAAAATGIPGKAIPEDAKSAATSYLCVAEGTVGFGYNKELRSWNATTLAIAPKYLLKSRSGKWTSKYFADPFGGAGSCVENGAVLSCRGLYGLYGGELIMSRESNRFVRTSPGTFVLGTDSLGPDLPYIQIGRCEPIDMVDEAAQGRFPGGSP